MSDSPDLEDLLKEVVAKGKALPLFKYRQILPKLDKLIVLQMRKLVTLQNLRDSIEKQYRSQGGWF